MEQHMHRSSRLSTAFFPIQVSLTSNLIPATSTTAAGYLNILFLKGKG
jgi:hypothetical protein